MAKKYHIAAKAAPPRFTIIGRHGIVDFNEDCAGACHHCVKKECIYDIYKKEGDLHAGDAGRRCTTSTTA